MMKAISSSLFMAAAIFVCGAQNPIIHDQFTADPTARVFNGRFYLYPSHDIQSPVENLNDWFCMEDYHVFSSDNLIDWNDHGVILTQNKIPWVKKDSYAMWAPDCVEKNGKYYFYFPAAPASMERGFAIGVAVAENPEGPFTALEEPIKGVMGIDPCVFIDDDGRSYLCWSGMGLWIAPLKENMVELAAEPRLVEGLPEGFKEGPFMFKNEGKYYFTFPWVRKKTETLAYAMADNPIGPYEFKGVIMDESPTGCWTNHHSIVKKDNQWYLFYHHNDYSPDMDKRRSVRIDSLFFNQDGLIEKVRPTLRGVGVADARKPLQIDRYSDCSKKGVNCVFLNPADKFQGWKAVFSRRGSMLRFNSVDFGKDPMSEVVARVKSEKGCRFQISDATGNVISDLDVTPCDAWSDIASPLVKKPEGVTDLIIKLISGNEGEIDFLTFK